MAATAHHHHQLHIFFFPLMAHGHMLPMLDIARLFASRHGVKSTFITTPLNASLFSNTVDRSRHLGLDITIQTIQFPYAQVGLPEGCEISKSITSQDMGDRFIKAFSSLDQELERLLQQHHPDCLVADMFFPWAADVAAKFGIPRLVFHGTCFFSLCVDEHMTLYKPHRNVSSDTEAFVVPGLPDRIELTRSQLDEDDTSPDAPEGGIFDQIRESEAKSYGVLVNSFYELEPSYVKHYKEELGRRRRKAWEIGPVSLCNRSITDKMQRGEKGGIDEHYCLKWLDSQKPNSVVYVSFGSESHFSIEQLCEIAMGLEASGVPFIWVVRTSGKVDKEDFLPEGFRQRIEGKGLVIMDWAPQVLILDHEAVGGFLTHCGWNSILEAVSAGVPMITWPLYAEQFYNEKFVTKVLGIGVEVGTKEWCSWTDEINTSVKREKVEKAVIKLMGKGDDEAERMRRRVEELGEMARKAVEEGGSSYLQLSDLIEELRAFKQQPK